MNDPPAAAHTIGEFVQGYESGRTLRGFRCARCGYRTATWGLACSQCGSPGLEEATLSGRGHVVAGTVVAVASDEFVNDAPYAYVLVELDGGGRLSGWVPGVRSEEEIAPGTPVRFAPGYKGGIQFERVVQDRTEETSR
jgi:uncharacterized OB-fold protein